MPNSAAVLNEFAAKTDKKKDFFLKKQNYKA
jgi:hypothetical protein